ncbi:hypothetical protein Nepgr_033551 [Nepenthes gracilis]|uniref:Uncharacterized protein n=1 Tax=Nepenthes gracilis TaxID=150966 RepID=A0AAD3Y6P5_NEPGR|nr:hypothetical protein Nepgr_033551 [Nepenthes gracilis]
MQLPIFGFGSFEVAVGAALYVAEVGMAVQLWWNPAAVLLRGHVNGGPALLLLVPPVVCGARDGSSGLVGSGLGNRAAQSGLGIQIGPIRHTSTVQHQAILPQTTPAQNTGGAPGTSFSKGTCNCPVTKDQYWSQTSAEHQIDRHQPQPAVQHPSKSGRLKGSIPAS